MAKAVKLVADPLQSNCLLTGQRMLLLAHSFSAFTVITPDLEGQHRFIK